MYTCIPPVTRRHFLVLGGAFVGAQLCPALESKNIQVPPQPYFAGVKRALETLAKLGAPVSAADEQQIASLARQNDNGAVSSAETILERYTLATLSIQSDRSVHIAPGGAPRQLLEQGWRIFLVRVENPATKTDSIQFSSRPQTPGRMAPNLGQMAQRAYLMDTLYKGPIIKKMWLTSELYGATAMSGTDLPTIPLSGVSIEYQVIQIFSRDVGRRTADFYLNVVPKADEDWKSEHRQLEFDCLPSRPVTLSILDGDGRGCVASLTVKDKLDRIYPLQAMRLAPDMFFHEQVYRGDGETLRLPGGEYTIESKRGPEYLRGLQTVTLDGDHSRIEVKLERWIDPAKWGWYSGDTHIHAAGCAHYQVPTEGVSPETMIRHMRGEALTIGDALNWSPSWYYQKQFFTGHAESPMAALEHPELQAANSASLQPRATDDFRSRFRHLRHVGSHHRRALGQIAGDFRELRLGILEDGLRRGQDGRALRLQTVGNALHLGCGFLDGEVEKEQGHHLQYERYRSNDHKDGHDPLTVHLALQLLRSQPFLPSLASRYAWRAESIAEPSSSFFRLTTSLPRSTHWLTFSRASRPRFFRYSLPSCALFLMASRVSLPERGAYSTPNNAPNPSPARNHMKLLPLSLSDIG